MLPRILRQSLYFGLSLGLMAISTGCIGSDKPRRVSETQFLEKPYVPPVDQRVLIPAQIQRDDLAYKKSRREIQRAASTPYKNSYNAYDQDIRDLNAPRKKILGTRDEIPGDE